MSSLPIAVDLDGTLTRVNSIWEQVVLLLRIRPWMIVMVPFWLLQGRPALKAKLAAWAPIERIALPFQSQLVDYLKEQSAFGREIVLVTAADQTTATHVASLFPFFRGGIGTSGPTNLAGAAKGEYLAKRYGENGFVYAGNEFRDVRVWERSGGAIVVNPQPGLESAAAAITTIECAFEDRPPKWRTTLRAMRPHQWLKNILVFVPVFTAHQWGNADALWSAIVAFISFCMAASGAYVLNDLLDLPSDRAHATKRLRPFASGDLPVEWGAILMPLLFIAAAALSLMLPVAARWVLAVYVVATLLYSFGLKRAPVVDVLVLAGLYTLRIVMGHEATGIDYSIWLTVFALCMFLSLALLKRYSELRNRNDGYAPGRGYHVDHRSLIAAAGVTSGSVAAGVIVGYAGSAHVQDLYGRPQMLYALFPLFLLWILRMWRLGYRGEMHEDPVLFTMHDLGSVLVGCATVLVMLLAR